MPPTISIAANLQVEENSTSPVIPFSVGDTETPAGELKVVAVSSNPALIPSGNIVFSGSGMNRSLVVVPAANQSGTVSITLTVSDRDGGQASSNVILTVLPARKSSLPPSGDFNSDGVADLIFRTPTGSLPRFMNGRT